MARAIWSGVLTFGLVSVPVELYSATEAHGPVFHQFEKGTADRIRYQRVNERTTDEVEYSDIVKGAETGGGHYVMLDQEELDSVAPGRSRSMEIRTFVDLDDIDPIYFNKTYYLGPGSEETEKVYALLRAAMGDSDKAAIASFVMRGKEYLAAVRADGDLLALETFVLRRRGPRAASAVMDLSEALRASVEAAKKTAGGKRSGRPGTAKQKAGQAEPARKARSRKPAAKKAPDKKAGKRPTRKRAA
jgi:DNA end-binding protein Ku